MFLDNLYLLYTFIQLKNYFDGISRPIIDYTMNKLYLVVGLCMIRCHMRHCIINNLDVCIEI